MRIIAALLLTLAAAPAVAQGGVQDLAALETRVVGALGAGIGEVGGPAGPIDRRLKLARCPESVAIEPPALGAITLRCASLGWRIRVPLVRLSGAAAPGVAAAGPVERAKPVVRRGDPVEMIAQARGFSVSTQAVAQEDGLPGERIRVRADAKSPVVIAEVVEMGRVRLPAFN